MNEKMMQSGPLEFKENPPKLPQLDRMLHFHLVQGGSDWAIRARHIRGFQRHPETKINVMVVTDMIGPQGPVAYEVTEGFDWCIEMYTAAVENRAVSAIANPQTRFSGGKIIS